LKSSGLWYKNKRSPREHPGSILPLNRVREGKLEGGRREVLTSCTKMKPDEDEDEDKDKDQDKDTRTRTRTRTSTRTRTRTRMRTRMRKRTRFRMEGRQ
jgi:hypothetical protein